MPLETIIHVKKKEKMKLIHKESYPPMQEVPLSAPASGSLTRKKIRRRSIDDSLAMKTVRHRSGGSLTVEASLAFPIFLFALVGVLFLFRVLQVTQLTQGALAYTGCRISLDAREEESIAKAMGYFYKELVKEKCPFSYVTGGMAGFRWSGTDLDGEYVNLQIQYRCRLPVRFFGIGTIPVSQHVKVKKWTGYQKDKESGTEELWVYITPNGTVYHSTQECTHLRLSIKTMGKQQAVAAGYDACLICGNDTGLYNYYYVTEEGDRYHTRLSCSGLKRTIQMIRFSDVGSRTPCSRCGSKNGR